MRIVLNTFGSFGDLHPYLAIAIELRRRGYRPLLATSEVYRTKVEAEGIEFAAVRPDVGELLGQTEFLKKLWNPKYGSEHLIRDYLMPQVDHGYEDLLAACEGADLLVTHCAAYAGPIVAEVRKMRWISIALQPAILFSACDPAVVAQAVWARHLYGLGRWLPEAMLSAGRMRTATWAKPVERLREKLGLPRGRNAVMDGQFSPYGTLACFSKHFAAQQPDWPVNTRITGFVSYDKGGEGFGLSADGSALEKFLAADPPPIVFTLGSSAVMAPGRFFEESAKAAEKLRMRAVMLVGKMGGFRQSNSCFVAEYAPYSQLLPLGAVTVHQGGIGTTAQALMAGRPMMVVPWAHDQPDNAERCRKLGVSRTVWRGKYRAGVVARHLDAVMDDPGYERRARAIAERLRQENGVKEACDALCGELK